MSLTNSFKRGLGKLYKTHPVFKRLKDDIGVPVRDAIFGKKAFYEVLDVVNELERENGKEVRCAFDVGAHIGDKAYVIARTFPNAKLYCFEPHPVAFGHLKKRMEPFGKRVQCFNFGFYNTNGTVDFFADGTPEKDIITTGTSSFVPRAKQVRPDTPVDDGVLKAQVRRLDDFVKEQNIEKIDFMKVDVEASEKEMIEGGKEGFARTDNLFIEIMPTRRGVHSHDYLDVMEALHQIGFSLFGVYDDFFYTKLMKEKKS